MTNNLISNILVSGTKNIKPEIGMGVTLAHWTDRDAGTIIAIHEHNGKTYLTVQEDNAVRTDDNGMSEDQTYEYSANPNGATYTYRQSKKGGWEGTRFNPDTKRWSKWDNPGLILGGRRKFYDFSF